MHLLVCFLSTLGPVLLGVRIIQIIIITIKVPG